MSEQTQEQVRVRRPGEEDEFVWVENLTDRYSVFRHQATGHKFAFEKAGFAGSILEVPARVARDPYFRRAVKRGNLGFLSEQDAFDRMENLMIPEDVNESTDHIRRAMAEGASESVGSRYVVDGLPEDARQGKEISEGEVWGHRDVNPPEVPGWGEGRSKADAERQRVSRLGTAEKAASVPPGDLPQATDLQRPLPPEQVLTPPGEFGE